MSVLDRAALEASPLADLHAIASELGLDGYRRLRKADLIDAIVAKQGGDTGRAEAERADTADAERADTADAEEADSAAAEEADSAAREEADSAAREEAGTTPPEEADSAEAAESGEADEAGEAADESERPSGRRRRGRRGGRGRGAAREDESDAGVAREDESDAGDAREDEAAPEPAPVAEEERAEPAEEEMIMGEVDLLPNGSGFVRVNPPEPSDDDVYISAAQVKRCELVSGDRIAGPRRAPRRSERFASLIRIDTINGRPASEVSEGTRFDDLPAAFPTERLKLGSEDPTVKAIEWLTPIGKGSRATITGPARAGKSEALKRLAQALAAQEDLEVSIALAGVRPEEITEWVSPLEPLGPLSFAASPEAQAHAIELILDRARRTASRGGDAVVLIDTLDGLAPHQARRLIAAARNIADGGSLTVIATSSAPVGGETTMIALDARMASTGRFPALDIVASGTLRPELLVGDAGASAIARAREAAD